LLKADLKSKTIAPANGEDVEFVALLAKCRDVGAELDLAHCVYGHAHSGAGSFSSDVEPYYAFLAGFVRLLALTHVAELGTHYGGSIQGLLAGLEPESDRAAHFATVDVTRLNREQLETHAALTLVQGDSLAANVVMQMCEPFDRHIDLLYVDTIHSYAQTLENTAVYANRLKPRFILFDDIHLNPEMERFWSFVKTSGAGATYDVTDIANRGAAGFGLLVCRYPFTWPESSARVRKLKRFGFAVRLRASSVLSYEQKARLRNLVGQATRDL